MGIQDLLDTLEGALRDIQAALAKIETQTNGDALARIRTLAVNGSLEASRSMDLYRQFHLAFEEIHRVASASQDGAGNLRLIRSRIDDLLTMLQDGTELSKSGASGSASRAPAGSRQHRVG